MNAKQKQARGFQSRRDNISISTREHLWTCEIAAISAERKEYCEAMEEFNREATDPGFVAPVVGC